MRAVLLSLLISCGGGDTPTTQPPPTTDAPPAEAKHETRDTLVIAYQGDIGYLLSPVYETSADVEILANISLPLIDIDFDCSLKKKPGIVTEWSWSEDGTILSMTMRDDIKFYDGDVVDAHDVAFTWELLGDPAVGSPRIGYLEHMKPGGNPKVIDDFHLEWHFTHAYDRDTQVAHASAMSIVPRHLLKDADRATLRGHPLAKEPLAMGPFRLEKYEPNERIVLVPNENFTGPPEMRAHLNRIIFRILPEYSTRLLELQSGNVDFVQNLTVADADRIRKDYPHIRIVRRGWRFMDYIAWNQSVPKFKDKRVRTALTQAIDVDAMIAKLLTSESGERYGRRATSNITPELCGVHNDKIKPLPFDLNKSRALMAEAGWTDSDGDGVLDKDGEKFEFTLTTNMGNKQRGDATILVQAHLEKLGVKVNLEKRESNVFFQSLRERDFEAALAGWSAALFVDPSDVWQSDSAGDRREFNFTNYSNPRADQLIETGLKTPDLAQAAPIWKELQAIIYEDQPYTFLWWMEETVAIDSRFENTEIDVLSPLKNLHLWEVPPDKVKYPK